MPSTSELSPIAAQHTPSVTPDEPVRVGIQPLELLKRHARFATIVAVAVAVLGFVFLLAYQKASYEATAIVYVSPEFPNALGADHSHEGQYEEFLEQQITAVTRYETLQKALRAYPQVWPAVFSAETEQNRIERLQKALKVEQVGHSYEVSITLQNARSEDLAGFVNAITAQYLADSRSEEVYGREQKLATLHQEKGDLQKQLDIDMQKQGQLLQNVGMAHFDTVGGTNPYDERLTKLREEYLDAHEKSAEADAELKSLGSFEGNSSPALQQAATEEVNADPVIGATKVQLTSKKAANLALMTGLKPSNPVFVQAEAENQEIDQRLDQINRDAVKQVASRIQQRAISSKAKAASLENEIGSDIARTTADASTAAPRLQQAQLLTSEVDRLLAMQGVIETRLQNVSLEGDSLGSVRLFSAALPPGGPIKRKVMLAYAALLLAALLSGFAAAFFADRLDPHIYTSRDIRRLVGFPPIGLLLNRTEFPPDMQREYFLRLAGGLDQAHRRTGARTFVFPSVGRSSSRTLVEQLGTELSANGLRVLVVTIQSQSSPEQSSAQADPVTPTSRLLSVTDGPSQLSAELDKDAYRVVSLPASGVSELLRRSRSYYNAILVAADPLFTSAYTEHFARTADGTVLIVDSGETRKDELLRAARLLERLKIAGIAIVLNGVTEKRAEDDVARAIADYRRAAA